MFKKNVKKKEEINKITRKEEIAMYPTHGEQQKKEIETIRKRTIELELSDADVKRIAEKAGAHGMTVGKLLESFIGDLVCGTYSNGSDERDLAGQWFDRCWFGMFPEMTFLSWLIEWGGIDEVLPTGIVRRVDDLGRIVIPKNVRTEQGITEGTPMEIFTEDGAVIFKKYATYLEEE